MAFWNDLTKKASETTAKAVHQAKVLADTAKLNGQISEEEKKIAGNYLQLGKLYVAAYGEAPEEGFAPLVAAITQSERQIEAYRQQIQALKGVTHCEKCGAQVVRGVAFCSVCGAAMPQPAPSPLEAEKKVCANCGQPLTEEMRFCTGCGTPVAVPGPIAEEPTPAAQEHAQEPQKRVCANCGQALDEEMLFCTGCGTKVE